MSPKTRSALETRSSSHLTFFIPTRDIRKINTQASLHSLITSSDKQSWTALSGTRTFYFQQQRELVDFADSSFNDLDKSYSKSSDPSALAGSQQAHRVRTVNLADNLSSRDSSDNLTGFSSSMGNQPKSHISDEIVWQTFSRTLPKRLETSTSFSGKSMTLREQQEEAFGIQVIKKERANETALSNMLLFNGEHHARKVSPNVTLDILSNNPKITWTQGSKSSPHEFSTSSLRGGDIGRVSGSGDPAIRTKSLLVKDSGKTKQFVPSKSKVESYLNNSPSFLNDNPFFTLDSLPLKDEAGSRDIKKLNLKLFSSEHLWRSCGNSLNISNFLDQSKKERQNGLIYHYFKTKNMLLS